MSANRHNIASFAERMVTLADAYKADLAGIVEEAKEVEVDTGALKRLASWKRKDSIKRDEAEALDHQYRFLAGEVPNAAELPPGGELATAVRLYGEGMTVTQVQAEMGVSRGKAHKLKTQAAAFSGVHVQMNANAHAKNVREMVEEDLGQYVPPKARKKKPEEDFGATVVAIIAKHGIKLPEPSGPVITDEEAIASLDIAKRHLEALQATRVQP